jgi:hypothetical protein
MIENPSFFNKLKKWLQGRFVCIRCKKEFRIKTFGYGTAICPECYEGERDFIFLAKEDFALNKLVAHA